MGALIFWFSYIMLSFSIFLSMANHPLSVGAGILLLYMCGSVVVSLCCSFVVGVFLFLTGVSGMIVAFLYVVALCPNPVFNSSANEGGLNIRIVLTVGVLLISPLLIIFSGDYSSFAVSTADRSVCEDYQWYNDPTIYGGLSELIPLLGLLLFLCMVSVVVLCGKQKQCLGGHSFGGTNRYYT